VSLLNFYKLQVTILNKVQRSADSLHEQQVNISLKTFINNSHQ